MCGYGGMWRCNGLWDPKIKKTTLFLKKHFSGIVSLLFTQEKDIMVGWMQVKDKNYETWFETTIDYGCARLGLLIGCAGRGALPFHSIQYVWLAIIVRFAGWSKGGCHSCPISSYKVLLNFCMAHQLRWFIPAFRATLMAFPCSKST